MVVVAYGFYDHNGTWFTLWTRHGINNYSYELADGNTSGIIARLRTANGYIEVPRKHYSK